MESFLMSPSQPSRTSINRKRVPLTDVQGKVLGSKARFRVWVAGRRSGKTFTAGGYLIQGALDLEPEVNAYIAPTYRMAKRIAWDEIKAMVPKNRVVDVLDGELTIKISPNYAKWPNAKKNSSISLFGADNPDSLRGLGLRRFVMDEYADMDARTFPEVVRPMLATTRGDGMFIGTPKGFNHFHELYERALEDRTGEWFVLQSTTLQGGLVRPSEIEAARRDMSDRQFRQEYEASFEALTARVFYAFSRENNVRELVQDNTLPIFIGIDFNISPGMHAVCGHKVSDQIHIIDEIMIPNGNTEELAREAVRRFGVVNINGVIRKRRLIACPDPTGKRRQTNAPIGQTDHKILNDYGIEVRTPYAPYASEDKINTTNAALRTAAGTTRAFIHPRCKKLITGLEGLTYKGETGQPDKSGNHDHITDAFAYLICMEIPMVNRVISNTELVL